MLLELLLHNSVRNYSTILRNSNAFKLGDLDVSERHLLLELTVDFLMYTCLRICLRSVLIGSHSQGHSTLTHLRSTARQRGVIE